MHDYDAYAATAETILADYFRIEDYLGQRMIEVSHFLCATEKLCSEGLGGKGWYHWFGGVFRDGVYVYSENHNVGIMFASVPDAQAFPGFQDSREIGNPMPTLSEGRWIDLAERDIPDEVRNNVLVIANALIRDAARKVLEHRKIIKAQDEQRAAEQAAERDAWVKAWSGPLS